MSRFRYKTGRTEPRYADLEEEAHSTRVCLQPAALHNNISAQARIRVSFRRGGEGDHASEALDQYDGSSVATCAAAGAVVARRA